MKSMHNEKIRYKNRKAPTLAYIRLALTHNARLLGSVQGVVVHAIRAALSGSPTMGNDTITAGSGTVYNTK
jgi:hypothetical protein